MLAPAIPSAAAFQTVNVAAPNAGAVSVPASASASSCAISGASSSAVLRSASNTVGIRYASATATTTPTLTRE